MNIIEGELNMKKLVLIAVLCVSAISANAQNNGQSLLQQLLGNDATSGTLKNILEDVVGGAVAKLDLSIEGTWKYQEPQVQFKSENLLAKAGGAASTAKIEGNLNKFYDKIGLDESMTYTFNADSTFTQTVKIGSSVKNLKGTYSLDKENKIITLKYAALGKVGLGNINAIYANTGTSLALLFDASDMMGLMKKIVNTASSLTGKTSIAALSKVMDSYDGALLGYKMAK